MKVVLKQDVSSIGKKGEVHEVSDGYARNFLFPRKLAVQADATAMNEVKTKIQAKEHHKAEEVAAAKALAEKLNEKTVVLKAKAGQAGRLFGSITAKDIAQAIQENFKEKIDKRKIVLEHEIKAFGTYEAELKIYPQITATIKVQVTEE